MTSERLRRGESGESEKFIGIDRVAIRRGFFISQFCITWELGPQVKKLRN